MLFYLECGIAFDFLSWPKGRCQEFAFGFPYLILNLILTLRPYFGGCTLYLISTQVLIYSEGIFLVEETEGEENSFIFHTRKSWLPSISSKVCLQTEQFLLQFIAQIRNQEPVDIFQILPEIPLAPYTSSLRIFSTYKVTTGKPLQLLRHHIRNIFLPPAF